MRTFEPGVVFDPKDMRAETRDGLSISQSSEKNLGKVKLCLFPALYSYPGEATPSEDQATLEGFDISSLVVQCQNFLRPGDNHAREEGTIISKGVVLLTTEK
jgi:hypothetical protein